MRFRALALAAIAASAIACGGTTTLFQQYEYEEDLYLSLDASATLYVNSSLAALNALRGTAFDLRPNAQVDRDAVRAFFSSPNTHVIRVSPYRRSGRRYVSVRMEVEDVRTLGSFAPFSWSSYRFGPKAGLVVYEQTIGDAAGKDVGNVGWSGAETVAFRLHLPSKIEFHNTKREIGRGNILAWEQPLSRRLRGERLDLEARIQTQSILYSTLILFGASFVAAAIVFIGVIWWVVLKGKPQSAQR
jgi:hypothetical protein